jgi:hypothetical protein
MASTFDLPSALRDAITTPPFRVQIAFEGNWMEAWRFEPNALPSREVIQKMLAGREANVAIEFCFKLLSGENFFFGQRRLGEKGNRETLEFLDRALGCSLGRDWIDFPDFLSRLERAMPDIDGIGADVLCRSLDSVEIGITDWWQRGDVVKVWDSRAPVILDSDQLKMRMVKYPSLHRNNIKFVCLEFNFKSPLHHWFGIEISDQEEGVHTLRISKADSWMVACFPNSKNEKESS